MDIQGKKIETKIMSIINPMSSMQVNKQAIKERTNQKNEQLFLHAAPARCNEKSLIELPAVNLTSKLLQQVLFKINIIS